MLWASRHLLASSDAAAAWAFQEKLEQSQWLNAEQHRARQIGQLSALLRHAAAHVPAYADSFVRAANISADTEVMWQSFPVLTRERLQANGEDFVATHIPPQHGKTSRTTTSGSTSRPVSVLHTDISAGWHRALTLRSQLWALSRFDGKLAAIRRYVASRADYPNGFEAPRWADASTLPMETGPVAGLSVATPLHEQIIWLKRHKPDVLVTFPTNLDALCRHASVNKIAMPRLKAILTLGEAMPEGIHGVARRVFGARVADTYSAAEVGEIAIQCPQFQHYHVQSESVLVEILDEAGQSCGPGETGRIVLTALHNYATPLIRYEIGDLATVGRPCACGRGLPVIAKVLGRHRNMMVSPDGSWFWPSFGLKSYMAVAPVLQGQFIQHTPTCLEVALVTERPLKAVEEEAIRQIIVARMPALHEIKFSYPGALKRGASGKFEEFICKVDDTP